MTSTRVRRNARTRAAVAEQALACLRDRVIALAEAVAAADPPPSPSPRSRRSSTSRGPRPSRPTVHRIGGHGPALGRGPDGAPAPRCGLQDAAGRVPAAPDGRSRAPGVGRGRRSGLRPDDRAAAGARTPGTGSGRAGRTTRTDSARRGAGCCRCPRGRGRRGLDDPPPASTCLLLPPCDHPVGQHVSVLGEVTSAHGSTSPSTQAPSTAGTPPARAGRLPPGRRAGPCAPCWPPPSVPPSPARRRPGPARPARCAAALPRTEPQTRDRATRGKLGGSTCRLLNGTVAVPVSVDSWTRMLIG